MKTSEHLQQQQGFTCVLHPKRDDRMRCALFAPLQQNEKQCYKKKVLSRRITLDHKLTKMVSRETSFKTSKLSKMMTTKIILKPPKGWTLSSIFRGTTSLESVGLKEDD
jgi:hypothetical protein